MTVAWRPPRYEHGAAAVNSRITGGWRRTRDVDFSRSAATLACTNTPSESEHQTNVVPQTRFRLLLCASLILPLTKQGTFEMQFRRFRNIFKMISKHFLEYRPPTLQGGIW